MSGIITKPDGTKIVTVRLTLKPGLDDEIIDILENAEYRHLASTIVSTMKKGAAKKQKSIEEDDDEDFDLSGFTIGRI